MITIGNTSQNMRFTNTLNMADFIIKQSTQRLSTGFRINSPADDPAGFQIAAGLQKQIRGTEVANQNSLMAQSYLSVADSALTSMMDSAFAAKNIASQALATTDPAKRAELQNLAKQFVEQMYKTESSAKFGEETIFATEGTKKGILTEEEAIAQGYTVIKTADELQAVASSNMSGKYILMEDIDLSSISNWEAIGKSGAEFKGTFDGNGFTISNLKIDKGTEDGQGFFGVAMNATIKNVQIVNASVTGKDSVGILVGNAAETTISNSSVSGNVTGGSSIGGMIGTMGSSGSSANSISNSFSNANVNGKMGAGGLVGTAAMNVSISNSYATGSVTGSDHVGGLIGLSVFSGLSIKNSYASGNVNSTSDATAASNFGGLIGKASGNGTISNSYSTGQVKATIGNRGGFIGNIDVPSLVVKDYAYANQTTSGVLNGSGIAVGTPGSGSVLQTSGKAPEWFSNTTNQKSILGGTGWDYSGKTPKLTWEIPPSETKPITFQVGADTSSNSTLTIDMALNIKGLKIDFSSDEAIRRTMDDCDAVTKQLEKKGTLFSANKSILDGILTYQENTYINLTDAKGRIVDTNIADETYRYSKAQIVAQTTTALKQQTANLNASICLSLIGGIK